METLFKQIEEFKQFGNVMVKVVNEKQNELLQFQGSPENEDIGGDECVNFSSNQSFDCSLDFPSNEEVASCIIAWYLERGFADKYTKVVMEPFTRRRSLI